MSALDAGEFRRHFINLNRPRRGLLHGIGPGRESRFLVKLGCSPLWELKPTSRGGEKGGSRIYLFLLPTAEAGLVNCEVKEAGAPTSQEKLLAALRMMKAHNDGIPVFEERQ